MERDDQRQKQKPSTSVGDVDDENDLVSMVDALLQMSFDEALKSCQQLNEYVYGQNRDPDEVKALIEEFKVDWHPEAPAELRHVLEELLDPEAAAASAAATQALLQGTGAPILQEERPFDKSDRTLQEDGDGKLIDRFLSGDGNSDGGATLDRVSSLLTGSSGRTPTELSVEPIPAERQKWEDLEELQEDDTYCHVDDDRRVDELLSMSFEEALDKCEELRRYVQDPARGEAKELTEEFRNHWGVEEAPVELRAVLRDLLNPNAAAANAAEAEAFEKRMRAMQSHDDVSQKASDASVSTRSRL
eukprot:TRINITY_DN9054_c3_g1_i1.p1 TRINITY_DN9054_c3_g1~~TRINITY_DN9054_c3_g1_i1.p1  ORF type:complete len:317 (+),score=89.75 TRINITY_DN9054_c3_g1_i1:45-953(+)